MTAPTAHLIDGQIFCPECVWPYGDPTILFPEKIIPVYPGDRVSSMDCAECGDRIEGLKGPVARIVDRQLMCLSCSNDHEDLDGDPIDVEEGAELATIECAICGCGIDGIEKDPNLITATLLAHFASALVNGDDSGITEEDAKDFEAITDYIDGEIPSEVIDVADSHYGTCEATGWKGEVATYTIRLFPVEEVSK